MLKKIIKSLIIFVVALSSASINVYAEETLSGTGSWGFK